MDLNIPLLIVIAYVLGLLGIGFWASRLVRQGKEGFFLAGRKLSAALVAVTVTGLAVGGASTVGVAEKAFSGQGLAAGWYGVAWAVSAVVVGLVVSRRYRALNVVTVPQMFDDTYGAGGHLTCVVTQVLVQIVITSLQYIAGGAILTQLLPDVFPSIQAGIVFSAVVFITLTITGGLWSASLSNVLNVALIYGGVSLAALLSLRFVGGWDRMAAQLPADVDFLRPIVGVNPTQVAIFVLVMVTCNVSFQATVQIAFAARDERTARRGFLLAGLLILPVSFLAALIGVAARAEFPEAQAVSALPTMVNSLPPVVAGITLASLWAADVSTACGLLLSSSTIVVRDVYARYINPSIEDTRQLLLSRVVVLVIGLLTVGLALSIGGNILGALMQGLSLTTGPTIVVLGTFFLPDLCRRSSAVCVIVTSLAVMAVWSFVPAARLGPHVIFAEWVVCLAAFLIVPLLDSRRIE